MKKQITRNPIKQSLIEDQIRGKNKPNYGHQPLGLTNWKQTKLGTGEISKLATVTFKIHLVEVQQSDEEDKGLRPAKRSDNPQQQED